MPGPRKFPLKLNDGTEVRRLEELRVRADLVLLVNRYQSGALLRWLRVWGYQAEAEQVSALSPDQEDFRPALCAALGIPYTEDLEAAYQEKCQPETVSDDEAPQEQDQEETAEENQALPLADAPSTGVPFDPDAVAKLISWDSNHSRIYETEDYFLVYRSNEVPWVRYTKDTGAVDEVPMPANTRLAYGREFFCAPPLESPYAVRKNKIYYVGEDRVMVYDLERMKGSTLAFQPNVEGISQTTSMGKLAIYTNGGLYLLDIHTREQEEITYQGKHVLVGAKGGVAFANGNLFFFRSSNEGLQNDEEVPLLSVCSYGLSSKKVKVVWEGRNISVTRSGPGLTVCGHRVYFSYRMWSGDGPYVCCKIDLGTMEVKPMPSPPGDTRSQALQFFKRGVIAHTPVRSHSLFTLYPGVELYFCSYEPLDKYALIASRVQYNRIQRVMKHLYEIGPWFYYRSTDGVFRVQPGAEPEPVSFWKEAN